MDETTDSPPEKPRRPRRKHADGEMIEERETEGTAEESHDAADEPAPRDEPPPREEEHVAHPEPRKTETAAKSSDSETKPLGRMMQFSRRRPRR